MQHPLPAPQRPIKQRELTGCNSEPYGYELSTEPECSSGFPMVMMPVLTRWLCSERRWDVPHHRVREDWQAEVLYLVGQRIGIKELRWGKIHVDRDFSTLTSQGLNGNYRQRTKTGRITVSRAFEVSKGVWTKLNMRIPCNNLNLYTVKWCFSINKQYCVVDGMSIRNRRMISDNHSRTFDPWELSQDSARTHWVLIAERALRRDEADVMYDCRRPVLFAGRISKNEYIPNVQWKFFIIPDDININILVPAVPRLTLPKLTIMT